jgi:mRNA-degrading endonuclease toxin of MazEF toxin-antitoxin module
VRQLGDVHDRTDTEPSAPRLRVVVVSHELYNQGTGMVFVCPVHRLEPAAIDYPLFVQCRIAGSYSLIISDQLYRMPVAGLGEPPVDRLGASELDRVRAAIRGIFS